MEGSGNRKMMPELLKEAFSAKATQHLMTRCGYEPLPPDVLTCGSLAEYLWKKIVINLGGAKCVKDNS